MAVEEVVPIHHVCVGEFVIWASTEEMAPSVSHDMVFPKLASKESGIPGF